MDTKKFTTIDEYISAQPKEVQGKLNEMRKLIKKVAPKAEEAISYGMPTFKLNGNLVHFAAFKNHIGFYPMPLGLSTFQKELAPYITGKGTAQFPLDKSLPLDIIRKVVQFRVDVNMAKGKKK